MAFYKEANINSKYLSGLSLTMNPYNRSHLWSWALGRTRGVNITRGQSNPGSANCPCSAKFPGLFLWVFFVKFLGDGAPSFVNQSYYCDSSNYTNELYFYDGMDSVQFGFQDSLLE